MPWQLEDRQSISRAEPTVRHRRGWIPILVMIVIVALLVMAGLGVKDWPFTRAAVEQALQQQSAAQSRWGASSTSTFRIPAVLPRT
jgi:hypothetical protein